MADPRVEQAIHLADQGDKSGAQRILAQYLQGNPNDEYAWLWLAYILPDRAQQQQALQQCLKFIPNSQGAREDLDSLRLGAPLNRPVTPPPYPSPYSPGVLERDLFLPESEKAPPGQASSQDKTIASGDIAALENLALGREPAPKFEARLKQPAPKPEPEQQPEWARSFAVEETPPARKEEALLQRAAPARGTQRAVPRRTRRRKKSRFTGWQIGCLGLLTLIVAAVVIVGGWILFSAMTGSNPLSAFLPQPPSIEEAKPQASPAIEATATTQPYPGIGEAAAAPPISQPAQPPVEPTPTSQPVPTSPPLVSISIPAPLYFLSDQSGISQIWRLAADGSSLVQITNEKHPVTEFDVSPANGQLAYITNNSLYLINSDGSKRKTLVYGQPLPSQDDPTYWKILLSSPVWSPDGTLLAFAQEGIQVIDLETTITKRLEPNLYIPTDPSRNRLYYPLAWSPEAERIVVLVQRETCNTLGIVFASGFSSIDQIPITRGQPVWSLDGLSLIVGQPYSDCSCGSGSGLWQVDAANGKPTVLSGGMVKSQAPASFIGWPKVMADGTLLSFAGEADGPACTATWPETVPLSMVVATTIAKNAAQVPLRQDSYVIGDALWAPDGSLAIITDMTNSPQAEFGPLLILNGDGSPAIALTIDGRNLRWGIKTP